MRAKRIKPDRPEQPGDPCGRVFASYFMAAMYKKACRQKILALRVPSIDEADKTPLKDFISDIVRSVDMRSWKRFSGVTASSVTSKLEKDIASGAFFVNVIVNWFKGPISRYHKKIPPGYKQRRSILARKGLYKVIHAAIASTSIDHLAEIMKWDILRRYKRDRGLGLSITEIKIVEKHKVKYVDIFDTIQACNRHNYRDCEETYASQDLISEIGRQLEDRVFNGKAYSKLRSIGRGTLAKRFQDIIHDFAIRGSRETNQKIVMAHLDALNPTDISRLFKTLPSPAHGKRGEAWEIMKSIILTNKRFADYYGPHVDNDAE